MPVDHTARVAEAIRGELAPGEQVVSATPMDLTAGADRSVVARPVTADERPVDERGAVRRGVEGAADVLGSLATNTSPFNLQGPDVDRWLNGAGVTGAAGSVAQHGAGLLRTTDRTFLVVTDRRIIVAVDRRGFGVLGFLDRALVRGAQRRPKLIFRGRVVLEFADGSTLAVQTNPPFGRAQADRFVAALAGHG